MASEAPIEHPAEWPVTRLGDIALKIGSGATPRGGADNYLSERDRFALIRSQNVFDRHFDYSGLAFISDQQASELQNAVVQPRDLLLNITGDGITFSRCCAVPEEALPACVNQHVSIVRMNPELADPGFVLGFLTHPAVKSYMESFNAGGSRRAITKGYIESFRLPLPPLHEQKTIARILGALDDKIELNRKMNETLEAMARALFKSWFVDFDPVRAKAEGRDTGLPAHIAALFPDSFEDSELGKVPEGWMIVRLDEVIEIFDSARIPLSRREREKRPGPYPYYGAASVMDHVDAFLFDGVYLLMGEDGSVINDDGSPVLQYVWGRFWVNNHAHVLRGSRGICTEHLLLHLGNCNIAPFVTGAVQLKLNQGNLNRIRFNLPSSEITEAFANIIGSLFNKIRINADESNTLVALRDTLLPRLISGKIRVKSAPRSVEAVV